MTVRAAPVVIAATSGTGKTTLAHRLVEHSDRFVFSVSATTRAPRSGERDGVDYHFIDRPEFERMIAAGELAEWAEVHDHLYGTPKAELDGASRRGQHAVLDIDVQGARQIRETMPDSTLIFVLPPSVDIMMERLRRRGTEDEGEVARRLRSALDELRAARDFDHVVVNDDLVRCLGEIEAIVEGRADGTSVPRENIDVFRAGVAEVLEREYANT